MPRRAGRGDELRAKRAQDAGQLPEAARRHQVCEDGLAIQRSEAVHPADALHDAHRVPRQVVVHDGGGVLQVHALARDVGRDQYLGFEQRIGA